MILILRFLVGSRRLYITSLVGWAPGSDIDLVCSESLEMSFSISPYRRLTAPLCSNRRGLSTPYWALVSPLILRALDK